MQKGKHVTFFLAHIFWTIFLIQKIFDKPKDEISVKDTLTFKSRLRVINEDNK